MSNEHAIVLENVGKRFRLRTGGARTLKSAALDMLQPRRRRRSDFWALRGVNLAVAKGETLGVIGPNGAGKSTILSLVTGTTPPTEGRLYTHGTVSSLLELGAGFHPDLTGRENIFLAGSVLGLTRRQMADRFDDIVAFSEIEQFIDQPVKHYSSGMYVRLGFAVAVEVDPDILLIDEVLAVGDASFQKKCIARIADFRKRGKTMLIGSHDLETVTNICNRAILLDHGETVALGDAGNVVSNYRFLLRKHEAARVEKDWGTGEVRITNVEFFCGGEGPTSTFHWGRPVEMRIHYEASRCIENPVFGFAIRHDNGHLVFGSNTQMGKFPIPAVEGPGTVSLHLDDLPLAKGRYLFSASSHSWDHTVNYHRADNQYPFEMADQGDFEGSYYMATRWTGGSA